MRTKTVNIYQFNELSDDAKEKALNTVREWQVDNEWWDGVYEDANNVGIKITSFDLDRNRGAQGEFIESATDTANKIVEEHGPDCETYKTSRAFLNDRDNIILLAPKDEDGEFEDVYKVDNDLDDLEEEFLKSILEDYSLMLQKEYEYLLSDEAVTETIEANEYEFTEDGKISR